jgi:hypothetical protein
LKLVQQNSKVFAKSLSDDAKKAEKYTKKMKLCVTKLIYLNYSLQFYKIIAVAPRNSIAKDELGVKFNAPVVVSRHFSDNFSLHKKLPDGRNCVAGNKFLMSV